MRRSHPLITNADGRRPRLRPSLECCLIAVPHAELLLRDAVVPAAKAAISAVAVQRRRMQRPRRAHAMECRHCGLSPADGKRPEADARVRVQRLWHVRNARAALRAAGPQDAMQQVRKLLFPPIDFYSVLDLATTLPLTRLSARTVSHCTPSVRCAVGSRSARQVWVAVQAGQESHRGRQAAHVHCVAPR